MDGRWGRRGWRRGSASSKEAGVQGRQELQVDNPGDKLGWRQVAAGDGGDRGSLRSLASRIVYQRETLEEERGLGVEVSSGISREASAAAASQIRKEESWEHLSVMGQRGMGEPREIK